MNDRERRTWGWALGLSVVLALVVGVAMANPKPPPDPVTGEIYYEADHNLWSMDPDGNNKTRLNDPILWGTPSFDLHGGQRWFIDFLDVGGTYPDGRPVWELVAYNDTKTVQVQLTDDPLLEVGQYPGQWGMVTWTSGDTAISWVAHSWVWDEATQKYAVDKAGIWYLPVTFYMDGNQMKIEADGTPTVVVECDYVWDGHVVPSVGWSQFSWSPDNTQIVYSLIHWDKGGTHSIHIKDITTGSTSDLVAGWQPAWSSADQIAYRAGDSIYLINPDRSGQELLVSGWRRSPCGSPHFSPDGGDIVFNKSTLSNFGDVTSRTIKRVSVSTGRIKDLKTQGVVENWR